MKTAFAHDWLLPFAGGDKVLEALAELHPGAPIHVLVQHPEFDNAKILAHPIKRSFIERLPAGRTKYRRYLPLMPLAIEQFDLRGHELVLSTSHAVAKGVLTDADQLHVSYVHTPMRYAWDMYHAYLEDSGLTRGLRGALAKAALHYLRLWDRQSADRADLLVANSRFVARRIAKTYRREAPVVYPPVDVARFRCDRPREDYYFTVSRMVPYKRFDLLVRAMNRLGRPFVVAGDGPEMEHVRRLAGPNVTLLGEQPDDVVTDRLERCRAFLFAAEEDFGISPVEAMAAGAPVICYGRGGTLETVADGVAGLHFGEQSVEAIADAVERFEARQGAFDAARIREHAERFSVGRFQREMTALVDRAFEAFRRGEPIG